LPSSEAAAVPSATAGYYSLAALAMGRTMQLIGAKRDDPGLVSRGAALEERATAALDQGKVYLDPEPVPPTN